MKNLQPLVAKLKACPTRDTTVSRELLVKTWEEVRQEKVPTFLQPSGAIMAALVVSDVRFAQLLGESDRAQLQSLVQLVADRYEQTTNPPNKLGKLINHSLKST
jgi:hypothetical protein